MDGLFCHGYPEHLRIRCERCSYTWTLPRTRNSTWATGPLSWESSTSRRIRSPTADVHAIPASRRARAGDRSSRGRIFSISAENPAVREAFQFLRRRNCDGAAGRRSLERQAEDTDLRRHVSFRGRTARPGRRSADRQRHQRVSVRSRMAEVVSAIPGRRRADAQPWEPGGIAHAAADDRMRWHRCGDDLERSVGLAMEAGIPRSRLS